ncbi:oplophorus-luciferin 2-monooxygenase non-catalytic subunit-like isoform X3 [Panulirus ornatus]
MKNFPCPEAEDIAPCQCTFDAMTGIFDLLCVGLNETQLDMIFAVDFPFDAFTTLTLQNSNIPVLKENVFGSKNFKTVIMIANKMKTVMQGALNSSYTTLESFYMSEMDDEMYNWPLPDLSLFTVIQNIGISGPYDSLSPLVSCSLISAFLSLQKLTELPVDTLSGAPNLEKFFLDNTKIERILANTFQKLQKLVTISVSGGNLTELEDYSFSLTAPNLTLIDLHLNGIKSIGMKAFEGISGNVTVNLSQNQLMVLEESNFLPLLKNTSGIIDISSNPLMCGCDIYWIVNVTAEELQRLKGLDSSCAIGDYSQDVLEDFFEYQCSTSL